MKRKICVITGSRAEYGLLRPLIDKIRGDSALKLQLIATGMHLSKDFGLTYRQIESDGFDIDEKIGILSGSDDPASISKAVGLGMARFGVVYERLRPDVIVVLGDRFELIGPVAAALVSKIPVAHIHGGELTEGAFDDAIRHSITKMSHLHFTSTEAYRKRVIQLGEQPERVFNVGALGLDNIKSLKLLTKKNLEKKLGIMLGRKNLLVTFHPPTLDKEPLSRFKYVLDALDGQEGTHIIFTRANADPGGREINRMIDRYVSVNRERAVAFDSMGQLLYLSTMRFVDGVVGNSSSGIIEAPSFKVGTINIGDRQKGRIKGASVIDCELTHEGIKNALNKLYSREFKKKLVNIRNPYGGGGAAGKIREILRDYELQGIIKKCFYDINFRLKD
jgi:UDP-hydrolysing UDP-N-acetyl-D-glucosamine 2-epimerase